MQAKDIHLWIKADFEELEHLIDMTVKEFGFIKNKDELCVYKKISGSAVLFLILYVDDILLIENVSQ